MPSPTVTNYIDTRYLTDIQFATNVTSHSHWLQPWRGYLETVPASTFINGVGVVMNASNADLVSQQLSLNGVALTRAEMGWGGLQYSTNAVNATIEPGWDKILKACSKWSLRPIILLNSNSSVPCPNTALTGKTAAVAALVGDTTITLNNTTGIVLGFSGITSVSAGIMCQWIVTAISGNVCTLSKPLTIAFSLNATVPMSTLGYKPFALPGSSDYINTLAGWSTYVLNLGTYVSSILGSGGFDMEVWNELGFASQFLSINNYYTAQVAVPASTVNTGETQVCTDMVQATATVFANNPSIFVGCGLGDGFANQSPFPASSTEPTHVTAVNKHTYPPHLVFPGNDENNSMVGATFITETPRTFIPSYLACFPEFALTGLQVENSARDYSPFNVPIYSYQHGRNARTGNPCQNWVTETGFNPTAIGVTSSPADINLKGAMHSRALCFFLHKGASKVILFAADGTDSNLGVCLDSFITYCATNTTYPTNPSVYTSPTLSTISNIVSKMSSGVDNTLTLSTTRTLGITSISTTGSNVQFSGDGTAAHPDLTDAECFTFLPFQVNSTRFVIPYYVMTRDTTTYPIASEVYTVAMSGLNPSATFQIYDPVANVVSLPISSSVTSTSSSITLLATDSPQLLIVQESTAFMYDLARDGFLSQNPAYNLLGGHLCASLVAITYGPNSGISGSTGYFARSDTDQYLSSIPGFSTDGTGAMLKGSFSGQIPFAAGGGAPTIAFGSLFITGNSFLFPSVNPSGNLGAGAIVFWIASGSAATSPLVAYSDYTNWNPSNPIVPNGSSITFGFSSPAIFDL